MEGVLIMSSDEICCERNKLAVHRLWRGTHERAKADSGLSCVG